jgi:acyl dehydratase
MTDEYQNELTESDISKGDTGPTVTVRDVNREEFVRYAGASGDFSPQHYSGPAATEAGYPSVFGQGMLTAGYAGHMVADWFGLENILEFSVRFEEQLWPGDTVEVTGEITEVLEEGNHLEVTAKIVASNQNEETILTGETKARLQQ